MSDCTDTIPKPSYVGRFAPSPTGQLHFGSLLAATASYLDARANQGQWLIRIEDLDPPREVPGSAADILRTLEDFNLNWDGEVSYQSQQHGKYQAVIDELLARQQAYYCDCSRKDISLRTQADNPRYDDYCRQRQDQIKDLSDAAIRVKTTDDIITFTDLIQGSIQQKLHCESGDFVIKRRDQLYAYQLAVVCDDADQGITHIVRGSDLLDSTPRQIYLQQLLGYPQPSYAHIPILLDEQGNKLSKQTQATALNPNNRSDSLWQAMQILGQSPPAELRTMACEELLKWAVEHWSLSAIPSMLSLSSEAGIEPL